LFGIRRRRLKVKEKEQVQHIETAQDALEDTQLHSNVLEAMNCLETEPPKTNDKFKYAMFILFGITGCYLSYKCIPMYIVSFNFVPMIHVNFLVYTKFFILFSELFSKANIFKNLQLEMYKISFLKILFYFFIYLIFFCYDIAIVLKLFLTIIIFRQLN